MGMGWQKQRSQVRIPFHGIRRRSDFRRFLAPASAEELPAEAKIHGPETCLPLEYGRCSGSVIRLNFATCPSEVTDGVQS